MNSETLRVMKLVEQGKISAEEALELLEAMNEAAPREQQQEPPQADATGTAEDGQAKKDDPFGSFFSQVESMGRSVAKDVNWKDISRQINQGVNTGVEALKKAADDAKRSGKFAVVFGAEETRTIELPLAMKEGATFRVEGSSGNIKIVPQETLGQVKIEGSFRGTTKEAAVDKARLFAPSLQESDQATVLRLPEGPDAHFTVTAHVPVGTPVEIKMSSGHVDVSGLKANTRITTMSGDVNVVGADGVVDVNVASGDVRMEDVSASLLTIETSSGNVEMLRVHGGMNVRSGSGDISLHEGQGRTISIETASGDAHVNLTEPVQGSLNVRTVSGDIGIEIPDGGDCRVSLNTLRGNVKCDLELTDEQREPSALSGKLGGGNGTLTASAVSGDVKLELRDASVE